MNPQEQALLAQLKDVVLPVSPGWWPPAIGWWVVLSAMLILCGVILWLLKARQQKHKLDVWRTMALEEHQRIKSDFDKSGNHAGAVAQLSVLMRRVALAVQSRRGVASLTDDLWLASLDAMGQTTEYSNGIGSLLNRHPYQREFTLDDAAMPDLFQLTRNTITNADPTEQLQPGDSVAAL